MIKKIIFALGLSSVAIGSASIAGMTSTNSIQLVSWYCQFHW